MKVFLTILLFLSIGSAKAINYYVDSTGGSDLNTGTSALFAWQTVEKVNAYSLSPGFNPGDNIYFKRGLSWRTKLVFASSGTSISPITIGAYGTGEKPVITGLRAANGTWTDSSHIWSITLTGGVAYQNMILKDGVPIAKGRYPNSTYLTSYPNSFTRLTLEDVLPANYVGAEAVTGGYVYIWDINKIIAQTVDSINLQTPMTYNLPGNRINYFIQNSVKVLDLVNDWSHDSTTKKLYIYSLDTPRNVYYSSIDTLVSNHNNSYVTYDGITITGANRIGFSADSGRYVTLQNSTVSNSGMNGVGLNNSPHTILYNDSIVDALNDGFYTRQRSDSLSVTYSYFKRCGIYKGMNLSGNAASLGVFVFGNSNNFRNNQIDSVGYHGYEWLGLRDTVYRNYITNFCINKSDGGGIYSDGGSTGLPQTGSLVRSNIVGHGINGNGNGVAGIYMDNQSTGVLIDSNTVFDIFVGGNIVFNGGTLLTCRNNTSFANSGHSFKIANGAAFSTSTIVNNIFYSTYRALAVDYFGVINGTLTEDSNYVLRATASDSLFHDGASTYYSIAAWRSTTSLDAHSTDIFPTGIESAAAGNLYSNPTNNNATININGRYKDQAGTTYTNSIVLSAFGSALLWRTTDQPVISHNIGNLIFD